MLEIHRLKWSDCLSHQIWPYIKEGWKDEDKKIHFFWGLGGANVQEIQEVERLGEEWWYIDVGYITEQITRMMAIYYYVLHHQLLLNGLINYRKMNGVKK